MVNSYRHIFSIVWVNFGIVLVGNNKPPPHTHTKLNMLKYYNNIVKIQLIICTKKTFVHLPNLDFLESWRLIYLHVEGCKSITSMYINEE